MERSVSSDGLFGDLIQYLGAGGGECLSFCCEKPVDPHIAQQLLCYRFARRKLIPGGRAECRADSGPRGDGRSVRGYQILRIT